MSLRFRRCARYLVLPALYLYCDCTPHPRDYSYHNHSSSNRQMVSTTTTRSNALVFNTNKFSVCAPRGRVLHPLENKMNPHGCYSFDSPSKKSAIPVSNEGSAPTNKSSSSNLRRINIQKVRLTMLDRVSKKHILLPYPTQTPLAKLATFNANAHSDSTTIT